LEPLQTREPCRANPRSRWRRGDKTAQRLRSFVDQQIWRTRTGNMFGLFASQESRGTYEHTPTGLFILPLTRPGSFMRCRYELPPAVSRRSPGMTIGFYKTGRFGLPSPGCFA
jgi:hypothetical protein